MLDEPATLADVRILIVEDEPLIAVMIEEFVQELGCQFCQTASTAHAAMKAMETVAPDVVILDVTLAGGAPNFEVADDLAFRDVPFVFCTGHDPDIVPDRYRNRPFVAKPFSMDEMCAAIARAMRRSPAERGRYAASVRP